MPEGREPPHLYRTDDNAAAIEEVHRIVKQAFSGEEDLYGYCVFCGHDLDEWHDKEFDTTLIETVDFPLSQLRCKKCHSDGACCWRRPGWEEPEVDSSNA